MWYQKFDSFVLRLGFMRSKSYHYHGGHLLVITLYVEDMLFFGNNKYAIFYLKSQPSTQFDMKYLGATKYILGMEIKRDTENKRLWLS
jgi:hypothetical protein